MSTPIAAPASLQWLGIAKETVYGTPVAAPTAWVPVTQPKWTPSINILKDQAMRGLMGQDYQQVQGQRSDQISYTTYAYLDSIYQHLLALLGNTDTVTGSADPYTHKTALLNGGTNGQPPSYTVFYFDGAGKCWQVPGCKAVSGKLDVKADELVSLDFNWQGLTAVAMGSAPANTPTTLPPMPSWNSVISIGGSAATQYSEVAITYTRDTKPVPAITGNQSPMTIFAGDLSVSADLTAVYQGSTDVNLVDFLANTQPTLAVQIAPAGDATHSLTLTHSKVAFDKAEVSGDQDWMEITGTVTPLMNATDALDSKQSPVQAVFITTAETAF